MLEEDGYPDLPRCYATCKLLHDTKQMAKRAAKRLGHYAYLCDYCKGWHTADNPAQKQRRYVRRGRRKAKPKRKGRR